MSDGSKFTIATFTRVGAWGDGLMVLTNNQNGWFNDEDLLEGPQSIGCLVGLTGYTDRIAYYVIYIFLVSQSNVPPRILFEKADWSRTWNAPTGANSWVTYDGVSYLCIYNGGWHKKISDGLLYQDSDNYQLMNFEFVSTGGAKLHYLGEYNKTSIDNAVLVDAIQYLLNEPAQGQGQGVITLTLKKPGQNLSFTSALLGKAIEQFISADTEVNFDGSTVGITLEGGKGDEVAIYDGSTLLKTVTFGMNEITATTDVPLNKAITFTSTKFKYGDDNTYFSKTVTITTVGETIKVMPDGALYWYGNECTDITGGWDIHNVEHHTYNGSNFSVLSAPLVKNKNSMYVGWDSEDLAQVPTTYYYSSSLSTNNAINYTHSTAKVKIKRSEAVKEVYNERYGVLGGCGYNTANSGTSYWNIGWGVSLDYPNNAAGENVLTNQYLSGSNSSTNVYFSIFVSVYTQNSARQYQNIEIEYFVLD